MRKKLGHPLATMQRPWTVDGIIPEMLLKATVVRILVEVLQVSIAY